MKKFLFVAVFAFTSIVLVNAQKESSGNQQAVQKTVIDLFQALSDWDLTKLKQNCTADVLILEHGEVWNLDTLTHLLSQPVAPDFKRINTFEFIETKISGETAWTTYHNQATVTRNGKTGIVRWLETAILSEEDGSGKSKRCIQP